MDKATSLWRLKNMDVQPPTKRFRISNSSFSPADEVSSSRLSSVVRSRLGEDFLNQEPTVLAKALLGKVLVVSCEDGPHIAGGIVETEAYLGMSVDKASHSFSKRTARNEPMFMKPGTVYVYTIYGMYHCLNISSQGDGTAVLLRAIEPISGIDRMKQNRCLRQKKDRSFHPHQLCNGPSKICIAFGIDKIFNKMDMGLSSSPLWIEDWGNPPQPFNIVTTARIGISKKADEWMTAPLRFYVMGCKSVSIADREEEDKLSLNWSVYSVEHHFIFEYTKFFRWTSSFSVTQLKKQPFFYCPFPGGRKLHPIIHF